MPFAHAEALTAAIRQARLVESHADSHLIWLARDWPDIAETRPEPVTGTILLTSTLPV